MRLDIHLDMKAPQDRLVRHLGIAIALKLVVLMALWWAFVRDERVGVDAERAAAHVGAAADAPARHPVAVGARNGAQP